MDHFKNIKNMCRVCLNKVEESCTMLILNHSTAEKLIYVGGSLEAEYVEETPQYICEKCESELEIAYNFLTKIKIAKHRINQYQHNQFGSKHSPFNLEQSPHRYEITDVNMDDANVTEGDGTENEFEADALEFNIEIVKMEDTSYMKTPPPFKLPIIKEIMSLVDTPALKPSKIESLWRDESQLLTQSQPKIKEELPKNGATCHICDKEFSTRANMLRHVREHLGRRFICNYENCNAYFTQRSSLQVHSLRHKGVKPFLCTICNKRFSQRKSLIFHNRVHTGETPYQCNYCEKSFKQKSNLVRHFKRHMKPTVIRSRIFECYKCAKFLASKQSLKRHYVLHDRVK